MLFAADYYEICYTNKFGTLTFMYYYFNKNIKNAFIDIIFDTEIIIAIRAENITFVSIGNVDPLLKLKNTKTNTLFKKISSFGYFQMK